MSYLTHDGERSLDKDLDLFYRLVEADPMHASPLEHVATPCAHRFEADHPGNFLGWDQYRHEFQSSPYVAR